MNPTYKVGDIVQIISEEEVRSHPTDDCGNFILIPSIYGANDSFHRDKLPVCGCPAVITRISKGNERNLYDLTPLFAEVGYIQEFEFVTVSPSRITGAFCRLSIYTRIRYDIKRSVKS